MASEGIVHWCYKCGRVVQPCGHGPLLCPYCEDGGYVQVVSSGSAGVVSSAMSSLFNTFFGPRVDPRINQGFIPGPEPWHNQNQPHAVPWNGPGHNPTVNIEWNGPIEEAPAYIERLDEHGRRIILQRVVSQSHHHQPPNLGPQWNGHGHSPIVNMEWNGPSEEAPDTIQRMNEHGQLITLHRVTHHPSGGSNEYHQPSYDHYLPPSSVEDGEFDQTIQHVQQLSINDTSNQPSGGPPPAPLHAIRNLPTVTISAPEQQPNNDCPVCQETFKVGSKEKIFMPCKHIFHEACIVPWLEQNNTCPVCRTALSLESSSSSRGRTRSNKLRIPFSLPWRRRSHR